MLGEIGLHVGVGPVEQRANLERAEVFILGNDVQFSPVGVLDPAQRRDPNGRRDFLHAALEGLELHERAELFEAFLVVPRGNRPVNRVPMRGGDFWQERLEVQVEQLFESLSVLVCGGAVVAVVHPKHGDVRLNLGAQVQDDGFIGSEVRGNDRAAVGPGDSPADDFEGSLPTQSGVPLCDLVGIHSLGNQRIESIHESK